MEFLRKLWETKQAKIGLAVVCTIAILAAAFLLQPAAKTSTANAPSESLTIDSSETTKESTSDTTSKTAETKTEDTESTMESQTSSAQEDSESRTETPASVMSENSDGTLSPNSQNTTTTEAHAQGNNETATVAEENPAAVEQDKVAADENKQSACTISIRCDTILNNLEMFNQDKLSILPGDGTILSPVTVTFNEGESVFDVLERVTREKRIHMEYTSNPVYNSAYIEGIYNIYEFDCGTLSGWMYKVNGSFPYYGCNRYILQDGDVIEFVYTCDLGRDVGSDYSSQQGGS